MKNESVLFLDIDGVLKPSDPPGITPGLWEAVNRERLRWCPMRVARLRRIAARTNCHIVISSNWRGYPVEHAAWKWKQMLGAFGWDEAPVIGETPRLEQRAASGIVLKSFRGDEVRAWLQEHGPVRAFVCLDDKRQFHPNQPLVQTDPEAALQDEQVERCIEILNEEV